MTHKIFFLSTSILLLSCTITISCQSVHQAKPSQGIGLVMQARTYFYKPNGDTTYFRDTSNLWYLDSASVEEIRSINTHTDTNGVMTVTYPVMFYRYVNLRTKTWRDYLNFSDTAKIIKKGKLPDGRFKDYGWAYFSDKTLQLQKPPATLTDTLINGVPYKKARVNFVGRNPKNNYTVGYWRCDGTGILFSKEKTFSRQLGCPMVKTYAYLIDQPLPYASWELDVLDSTLSINQIKTFEAWRKNGAIIRE